MNAATTFTREIRHFHLFAGLGGGARGFNRGSARVGNMVATFRCIGGIDVDPVAMANFQRLAGVPGTVMDLFSREQFEAFHGRAAPSGWREMTPLDVQKAAGGDRPHIVFLSAPCKGFSGLLAESKSASAKYQALNGLTLRGVWLMLEAWAGDPPELIIFENVPRIATRGRHLLDQIVALLRSYGYAVAETTHDCGEIGGLAQSRKRFLLVARHQEKVPPFLYEPAVKRLRGVGEVLEKLPLPGDVEAAGPMHRVPSLQWRTWVRLAFVEAGKDWRSLNRLRVGDDGNLLDFALAPEREWNRGVLGVTPWSEPSGVVTGNGRPGSGSFAVADPRHEAEFGAALGVRDWSEPSPTVIGNQRSPYQGSYSVADPRIDGHPSSVQMGVRRWQDPAGVVTGKMFVGGGPNAVADPRVGSYGQHANKMRVADHGAPASTVTGSDRVGSGALSVADPRHHGPAKHCNEYRIVPWGGPGGAATSAHGTGQAVADPRPNYEGDYKQNKCRVTRVDEAAGAVIAASTTGSGAFAVADPRADAFRDGREGYVTQGHYGVADWHEHSKAVTGYAKYDRGSWSVADPRDFELPAGDDRMVCRIVSTDGTWHRPFTTLELAALQSLFDPEEAFTLEGRSDAARREQIGNAVPSDAAEAIAGVMGRTLLLAWSGETFMLSAEPIWVRPVAIALAVDTGRELGA